MRFCGELDINEQVGYWKSATVKMNDFFIKQFRCIPEVTNEEYEQYIHVPDTNLKPPIT